MKLAQHRRRFASLAIVAAIALTGSIWFVNRVQAQSDRTAFLAYGMLGITNGQTMRLNAVLVNVDHEVPVELLFLDSQGNVIARSVDKLAPGHATLLDFRLPPGPIATRAQVRAILRWSTNLGSGGYVIPSLELIDDATGRTVVGAFPNPEG
jgi:hypothetical protein